jgi:ketosteroid isomerase-like protein
LDGRDSHEAAPAGVPPETTDAIRRVTAHYAHAIDRRAFHQLEACFHPDATYRFATIDGDWRDFVAAAQAILGPLGATHHQLGPNLIAADGADAADSETTFTAYHHVPAGAPADGVFPGTGRDYAVIIYGRYIDRFEQRKGQWRIARRTGVQDARLDHLLPDPPQVPAGPDPADLIGERLWRQSR